MKHFKASKGLFLKQQQCSQLPGEEAPVDRSKRKHHHTVEDLPVLSSKAKSTKIPCLQYVMQKQCYVHNSALVDLGYATSQFYFGFEKDCRRKLTRILKVILNTIFLMHLMIF